MFNKNDIHMLINGSQFGYLKTQHRLPAGLLQNPEMVIINGSPVFYFDSRNQNHQLHYGQIIPIMSQRHNVANIKINEFWLEDIRYISLDDCSKCGYNTSHYLLLEWIKNYDKDFFKKIENKKAVLRDSLKRPAHKYLSLSINFDVLYYTIDKKFLENDINFFIEKQLNQPPSIEMISEFLDYYFPKSDRDVIAESSLIRKSLPLIRYKSVNPDEIDDAQNQKEPD